MNEVRDAYQRAADVWQRAEMMQFGPAASSLEPGGQDLRDQVYSWPLVSRCAVETQLATADVTQSVSHQLVNRRGLFALEQVLFLPAGPLSCEADAWAARSSAEQLQRRADYAAALADDVAARAETLASTFETDFLPGLSAAAPGHTPFTNPQQALNVVSNALFYLELQVRDQKLATPLGLNPSCTAPPCLESFESQAGRRNTRNIRANLQGARALLTGCTAAQDVAFDDLLNALGSNELAQNMASKLNEVDVALDAVKQPDLIDAASTDLPAVRRVYDTVDAVTTVMKTELITVLNLELPRSLEGDND